jgi:O-antigen ligase
VTNFIAFIRKDPIGILLSLVFVFNLFVSTISNYELYSFILKGISSIVLWSLILYDQRHYNKDIKIFKLKNKQILLLPGILIYFILTLTYSQNTAFGTKKIIYLVISTVPAIIAFSYLVKRLSFDIFSKSILPVGIVTGFYVIIAYPFNQFTGYEFEIGRWSHAIYGRFSVVMFLLTLISLFKSSSKRSNIVYSLLTIFFIYVTFLTALRAAIIGILIVSLVGLLFYKSQNKRIVIAAVVIGFALSIGLQKVSTNPAKRLKNMTEENFGNDASITTRLGVYQIAIERFLKNPVLGVGIGGFNKKYDGNSLPVALKYPHNIFLEVASEFGVIGLLLLLMMLFYLLRNTYKNHIGLFLYLILVLWLAQFSKDIATNTMVWLTIIFGGNKSNNLLYMYKKRISQMISKRFQT